LEKKHKQKGGKKIPPHEKTGPVAQNFWDKKRLPQGEGEQNQKRKPFPLAWFPPVWRQSRKATSAKGVENRPSRG